MSIVHMLSAWRHTLWPMSMVAGAVAALVLLQPGQGLATAGEQVAPIRVKNPLAPMAAEFSVPDAATVLRGVPDDFAEPAPTF
jgi:hypothetical protein